jgi:uncharacterized protein
MSRANTARRAIIVGLGLALSGCAVTDPSKYYVLEAAGAPGSVAPAATAPALTVGVGPVTIPGYLERPQVVTRDAHDGVHVWPYHRWAEALDVGIARAVADVLGGEIPGDRIAVFPWRGSLAQAIDYQVVIAVARFEAVPGQRATLDARWAVLGKGNKELAFKRSVLTEPVTASDVPAAVAAMNRVLGSLGHEIGVAIRSQAASRSATRP